MTPDDTFAENWHVARRRRPEAEESETSRGIIPVRAPENSWSPSGPIVLFQPPCEADFSTHGALEGAEKHRTTTAALFAAVTISLPIGCHVLPGTLHLTSALFASAIVMAACACSVDH